MAIQAFSSINDIFDKVETQPNQLDIIQVYAPKSNPAIGDTLYFDDELSNPLNPNAFYGIFLKGSTYALRTDESSRIVELQLYIAPAGPDQLEAEPPLNIGAVEYNADGTVSLLRSKLNVNTSSGTIITDDNWNTNFGQQSGESKATWFSTERIADAIARPLQNVNVSDMEGFDLSIFISYVNPTTGLLGKYVNHYLHIPAGSKNRRVLADAEGTYYWMPPSHQFTGGLLPSFFKDFPDFDMPDGKYSLSQVLIEEDIDLKRSHKKGLTHAIDGIGPKRHYYDYEAWARSLGMPDAYTGDEAARAIWNNISEQAAIKAFKEQVVDNYKHVGVLTLNAEILAPIFDMNDGGKLFRVLNTFHQENPSAKLSIWAGGAGAIKSLNWQIDNEYDSSRMTPDLQFQGNYGDWIAQRNDLSVFGANYFLHANICDIYYVNDYYLTRYQSEHWLLQYLMMHDMNKKFYPDKTCLLMLTCLIETTVWQTYDFNYQKIGNYAFKMPSKPACSPGILFTLGAFSTGYGDGAEVWQNPYIFHDRNDDYGDWAFEIDNSLKPNAFTNYSDHGKPGQFTLGGRSLKNYDWFKAGQWAVCQNNDIVNANTPWQTIEVSVDGGVNWVTGTNLLFSELLIARMPVALFKSSGSGTEGLILFYDAYKDSITKTPFKLRLPSGQIKNIDQYGDYASIKRISI